ncbi:MAG: hypothetical protein RLZZ546_3188 [Bacteroidota bacterium]
MIRIIIFAISINIDEQFLKFKKMNPIVKNILALFTGLIVGAIVNMGFVKLGPMVIAPPAGANLTTEEGLKAAMSMMEARHFVFPFLAHFFGSLVGAAITAYLAANNKRWLALVVGGSFFIGGLMMIMKLPSPMWFNILDLGLAYFPAAFLGYKFVSRKGDSASHHTS